ncbi:hypothetical protein BC2230_40471 [Burkholderia cepacia]
MYQRVTRRIGGISTGLPTYSVDNSQSIASRQLRIGPPRSPLAKPGAHGLPDVCVRTLIRARSTA